MGSSLIKQTVKGFFWLSGVKVANAVFQFLILAILARLLNPTEFGLMGLASLVIGFADIFNDMGFGPAITQKKELSKTDIYAGFTYSLIFGLILLILVQLLSPTIALFFKSKELIPILRVTSFVILLKSSITTPLGLMYREMQFKKLSLVQIISYVLGYGVIGVTMAYFDYGVWSLVFAVLSQACISFILYLYLGKNNIGFSLNINSFKVLINFGGGYSLSKIFAYGANRGDTFVVGRILGVDALGLYERGFQIVKYASNLLGEVIDKVLFSPIARKQDNKKMVGEIYLELTYILAMIFFPFSAFMFSSAKPIVRIILGNQWDRSISIVQIMSISIFFLITTRIGSTVAKSMGDVYRRAWRTLIYAIYIVTSVYIGSKWGLEGAALAVSVGTVLNYLLSYAQVYDLTKVKHLEFAKTHGLGFLLGVFYFFINNIIHNVFFNSLTSMTIDILVSGVLLIITYLIGLSLDYQKVFSRYYRILRNE